MPPSGAPRAPEDPLSAAVLSVLGAACTVLDALRGGAGRLVERADALVAAADARLNEQLRAAGADAQLSADALDGLEIALREPSGVIVSLAAATVHLVAKSSKGCKSQVAAPGRAARKPGDMRARACGRPAGPAPAASCPGGSAPGGHGPAANPNPHPLRALWPPPPVPRAAGLCRGPGRRVRQHAARLARPLVRRGGARCAWHIRALADAPRRCASARRGARGV
jgi:hypothetical protein